MADAIFFVTDLQSAEECADLLNFPESILTFNEHAVEMSVKLKTFKDLFRKPKHLKKKKKWPSSVKSLRKVVIFSKKQKAHYEIANDGEGHWEVGSPIEEVYVRSLKTLRVVPWLQSLYNAKKKGKKEKKAPLFVIKPPKWARKHKKKKAEAADAAVSVADSVSPKPIENDASKAEAEAAEQPVVEPTPSKHETPASAAAAAAAARSDNGKDCDAADVKTASNRVSVVGSANDLFGDDGQLKPPEKVSSMRIRSMDGRFESHAGRQTALRQPALSTVREGQPETFGDESSLQYVAHSKARQMAAMRDHYDCGDNNGGPGGAWSTWPPPRRRTHGNHLAAQAAANAASQEQQQILSPSISRPASSDHEVTLRDIVGVNDKVLAWEAQRKGAAGDQAAKLNAAREDLEQRVQMEAEQEAAKQAAAERRRAEAERKQAEARFQAAIRAEQERLKEQARYRNEMMRASGGVRHPHSHPAPKPPASAPVYPTAAPVYPTRTPVYPNTVGHGGSAAAASGRRVVYPSSVARGGSVAQHQAHVQQRPTLQDQLRSQPDWQSKVQELAEFGGVSTASAEAVLENSYGDLKAGKLYFLERMSLS